MSSLMLVLKGRGWRARVLLQAEFRHPSRKAGLSAGRSTVNWLVAQYFATTGLVPQPKR